MPTEREREWADCEHKLRNCQENIDQMLMVMMIWQLQHQHVSTQDENNSVLVGKIAREE